MLTYSVSLGFWRGNTKERDHYEILSADGIIILKWIFKQIKWEGVN